MNIYESRDDPVTSDVRFDKMADEDVILASVSTIIIAVAAARKRRRRNRSCWVPDLLPIRVSTKSTVWNSTLLPGCVPGFTGSENTVAGLHQTVNCDYGTDGRVAGQYLCARSQV